MFGPVRPRNLRPRIAEEEGTSVSRFRQCRVSRYLTPFFPKNSMRISTGVPGYWAPLDKEDKHLMHAIAVSCYKPFRQYSILVSRQR
jgi:hypothetical protein